jgi:hypothetical protein
MQPALLFGLSGLLAVGTIYYVWARKVGSKSESKAEQK